MQLRLLFPIFLTLFRISAEAQASVVPARVVKCSFESLPSAKAPFWKTLHGKFINVANANGPANAELDLPFVADTAPKLYGLEGPPWDRPYFCTRFAAELNGEGRPVISATVKRVTVLREMACSKFTGKEVVDEFSSDMELPAVFSFDYRYYGESTTRRGPLRRETFYFSAPHEFSLGIEAEAEGACERIAAELPRH